jgi:uncharacterized RDD family membrane protein YckC
MAELDLRRAAIAGTVISLVMAATSSNWSKDQPRASVETLAVGLLVTLLVVVIARAIQTPASPPVGSDGPYGGFWMRAVALTLDYVPLYLVGLLLAVIGLGAITVPVLLGLGFVYFVGLWVVAGRTLGMRALGLMVVRENGGDVTLTVAVRRFLGLLLGVACVFAGVVWVAFDARKRGWADLVSGTVVVRTAEH